MHARDHAPADLPELQTRVAVHSLGWLLAGNAVGLLMAGLLLWPGLGLLLGPLTYGRWATVHLNVQLYGWSSVPLLGLLYRMYLPARDARAGLWALQAWSGALAFSSVAWLCGEVSGKPFLEWRGLTRWVMPAAMALLAVVLAHGYLRRLRVQAESRVMLGVKGLALLVLAAVPFALAWISDPRLYPAVNPDSGGATGGSLLGSTLSIIVMFLAFPWIIGQPVRRRSALPGAAWVLLALHCAWFLGLQHGDRSHHEVTQVIALSSLIVWWPLLVLYLRHFDWPAASRRWLKAFAGWGMALLATALFTFLPGVLDRWKFTNALVAHTHIAMAGMLSSFLVLALMALDDRGERAAALARTTSFVLWHGSAGLMCGVLLWLGIREADEPALVFYPGAIAQAAFLVRLCAGAGMMAATLCWFRGAATGAGGAPANLGEEAL